jgi:AraC-like DNA-binding protein
MTQGQIYGVPSLTQWLDTQTCAHIERHRHNAAYAAIILEGGYEEAGDHGRFRVGAGDVLVHGPFTSHLNRLGKRRTVLVNIPLPLFMQIGDTGRVPDPDQIAKAARKDRLEALEVFSTSFAPSIIDVIDEPDALAKALREDPSTSISIWSAMRPTRRETISRHFRKIYGVTAAAYRRDAKSRQAWFHAIASNMPFSQIALECAFADQSHMSRAVLALTGHSPAFWRGRYRARHDSDLTDG